MIINCRNTNKGLTFSIDEQNFALEYPQKVWDNYPDSLKSVFADNYAFLKALHLPQMLSQNGKLENHDKLDFSTSYPLFEKQIIDCMFNNISFCADVDNVSTADNLKSFLNLKISFKNFEIKYPKYEDNLDEKAVLNMSFGKDSLLSFGLANELGLEPTSVYMLDNSVKIENDYKLEVIEKFKKETGKEVLTFTNNTGVLHDYRTWKLPRTEWGYGHLMTEFFLDILPFAHMSKSKYILFGNEKSCDETYINKEGYKSYPVYDQTSKWLLEMTKMAKTMTNNQAAVMSLIEPLHDLAVTKILHSRYPNIAKFKMSCFPDENEYGKHHYWCEHCSKCARIFVLMQANGIPPKNVGFKTNMFNIEHKSLFSCFGVEKKEGASVGYDTSGVGKEEQLYAFYLAYKRGAKGELIEKFKKELLDEAKEKEEEFYKKYYSIQDSKTIPSNLLKPLQSIFKEELEK